MSNWVKDCSLKVLVHSLTEFCAFQMVILELEYNTESMLKLLFLVNAELLAIHFMSITLVAGLSNEFDSATSSCTRTASLAFHIEMISSLADANSG